MYWPFRKFLVSRGTTVPTFIPAANEFAEKFAQLAGGTAMSMLPEILFNVPGTAHCLGGSVIADSPERGVVDYRNRVFGYQQHVRLRRLGGRRQPGRESQPDHHCADRARHELHSPASEASGTMLQAWIVVDHVIPSEAEGSLISALGIRVLQTPVRKQSRSLRS